MDEQTESWMHQIRTLAPLIEKTEYLVFKNEADVKKLLATLKLKALADALRKDGRLETRIRRDPNFRDELRRHYGGE